MKRKTVIQGLLAVWVCFLTSCSAPRLATSPEIEVQELGICLMYGAQVPIAVQDHIEAELSEFIEVYNAGPNRYWLHPCADPEVSSLRLQIQHTDLVTSGENTAGILVSAVGLSLPFVMVAAQMPFYIFFYYFPRSASVVKASLSDDIGRAGMDRIERVCSSPGFLLKTEKQYDKHGVAFQRFVQQILLEMAKEERKALRGTAIK